MQESYYIFVQNLKYMVQNLKYKSLRNNTRICLPVYAPLKVLIFAVKIFLSALNLADIFTDHDTSTLYSSKTNLLIELIDSIMSANLVVNTARVLIFVDTRKSADLLSSLLASIERFKVF